jgi:capsular exopolysaccharide synthesis family protein
VVSEQHSSLRDYVTIIRRRWRWLAGAVGVAVAISAAVSYTTTPLYRSTAQLTYVRQADISSALGSTTLGVSAVEVQRESETYAQLMTTEETKLLAEEELGRPIDSDVTVEAEYVPDTSVLRISAVSDDPEEARDVANAYATAFTARRKEVAVEQYKAVEKLIRQKIAGYGDDPARLSDPGYVQLVGRLQDIGVLISAATGNFVVASAGVLPTEPFVPQHVRDLLIGLLVGLVAGIGLVALVEQLDVRVHTVEQIGEVLDLPILARVPRMSGNGGGASGPVTLVDPVGPNAEAFRIFRGNLDFADIDAGVRTLMVTSAVQGEGKSTTAANLAVAAALGGKRVILVDADLRRATVHRLFGLKNQVGLSSVLTGRATLADSLHRIPLPGGDDPEPGVTRGLAVLTSGPLPPNPGEIAGSQRLADLVVSLTGLADLVLVDAPPFLVVGDAGALSRAVDGVVVVARLGTVTRAVAHDSREFLATLPCRVLGVAVVGIPTESAAYRYRYYSKQSDDAGEEAAPEAGVQPTAAAPLSPPPASSSET